MTVRNNFFSNISQKLQQDSASWGTLALWVAGITAVLITLSVFANV
jgi:hypothetical protein